MTALPKPAKRGPKPRRPIARKLSALYSRVRDGRWRAMVRTAVRKRSASRSALETRSGDARLRKDLRSRSGGVCELCLSAPATDTAHGLPKGCYPALRHVLVNCAHLCRPDHGWVGSWATDAGLEVLRGCGLPGARRLVRMAHAVRARVIREGIS